MIYNHRYPQNIPIINKIYRDRFTHIYQLMPFYDVIDANQTHENIIPVYGNSIHFQGYMAQGLRDYYHQDTTHYIFIGDDLLLNPAINEDNYAEYFNLSDTSGFINNFTNIDNPFIPGSSSHSHHAYHFITKGMHALEELQHLPSFAEALEKFKQLGLSTELFDEK